MHEEIAMESLKLLQTPASCGWTRAGFRLSHIAESDQPESIMVCVRDQNERRSVELTDCSNCPHWVPDKALAVRNWDPSPFWRFERE
jgi:hypothetical protein